MKSHRRHLKITRVGCGVTPMMSSTQPITVYSASLPTKWWLR
jgi:hypothetical protein